jgi:putative DNA primase/helicase
MNGNDAASSDTRSSVLNITDENGTRAVINITKADGSELTPNEKKVAVMAKNCLDNPKMSVEQVHYNCRNCFEDVLSHQAIDDIVFQVEQAINIAYAKEAALANKNNAVVWDPDEIDILSVDELRACALTDPGNAKRFVVLFKDVTRFNQDNDVWHRYDGQCWEPIHDSVVQQLGIRVSDMLFREYLNMKEGDERNKHLKWAMETTNKGRISNLISFARGALGITNKEFDTHWNKLNMLNGVYDLEALEFHEGGIKEEYHSIKMPIKYDPDATCPKWREHINLIFRGNIDLIQTFQISIGYSLLGKYSEYFFINHGSGRNGKGVTTQTFSKMFGDYAACVDIKTIAATFQDKGIREDVANLRGKRFVYAEEPDKTTRLDTAFIKKVTGGGTVTAAKKYGHEFSFEPQMALWLNTNPLPKINDVGVAMKARLRVFPFTFEIPVNERKDPVELVNYFVEKEGPGIFNWIIEGLRLYWGNNGKIPFCDDVTDASQRMIFENDMLEQCIHDIAMIGSEERVDRKSWLQKVQDWCNENDVDIFHEKDLVKRMRDKKFGEKHTKDNRYWIGLRLKTKDELEQGTTQLPTDIHQEKVTGDT